jgi:cytochrome oxidase assembly protein ShyY1
MLWLLSPRWLLLHVATVAAIVGTVLLGQWQMRSYAEQEQRDREAAAAAALEAEPVPVAEAVPPGQPLLQASLGTLTAVTGEYDPAATLLLPGRVHDGQDGYHVVTPVLDEDGVATPVVRGWVADPDAAAVTPAAGTVQVVGVVTATESDSDATSDPRRALPAGQVPALTTPALFTSYSYPPSQVRQALVVAVTEEPAPPSVPERVPALEALGSSGGVSALRHLSYAWQWWLFAVAAIAFWVAFVRAGIRDHRPTPDPDPAGLAGPADTSARPT